MFIIIEYLKFDNENHAASDDNSYLNSREQKTHYRYGIR